MLAWEAMQAACPVPSDKTARARIASELEAAIKAGHAPNKLATEWERLNAGATACRGPRS